MFGDSFFKKVEDKTKVDKNTIISLANKLQNSNMKDENVLSELIDDITNLTGKKISEEKKKKIIDTIAKDNVPKDIDSML